MNDILPHTPRNWLIGEVRSIGHLLFLTRINVRIRTLSDLLKSVELQGEISERRRMTSEAKTPIMLELSKNTEARGTKWPRCGELLRCDQSAGERFEIWKPASAVAFW